MAEKPIDIKKAVEARKRKAGETHPPKKPGGNGSGINSRFVVECLNANELGDGMLYAFAHAGRFVYVKSSGEWLWWRGHHWTRDVGGFRAKAAVESGPVKNYLDKYTAIGKQIAEVVQKGNSEKETSALQEHQKKILRRIDRLRTSRGRTNCLDAAISNETFPLAIEGSELDQKPMCLACANGVIDLRTGNLRLGRPDNYLLKASPVVYKGIFEPAPAWQRFLLEIFEDDIELIDFTARLAGYAITGSTIEHIIAVFYGKFRNGKGVLAETLMHVLGDLAAPIPAEMLLDQGRIRNSAGPTPDIMSLLGLRMAFASETDEGRRFSHSKIKWFTGSDTLTGRRPHDKDVTKFKPSHTLFLLTNDMPEKNHSDPAFFERLILIPFRLSFVDREPETETERPGDKHLAEKLKLEASGILAWLVRGCLAWQNKGLSPPGVIKQAISQYRAEGDFVREWIDQECILDPAAMEQCKPLYENFKLWFESVFGEEPPFKVKTFSKIMRKRFIQRTSGTSKFYGLRLKTTI